MKNIQFQSAPINSQLIFLEAPESNPLPLESQKNDSSMEKKLENLNKELNAALDKRNEAEEDAPESLSKRNAQKLVDYVLEVGTDEYQSKTVTVRNPHKNEQYTIKININEKTKDPTRIEITKSKGWKGEQLITDKTKTYIDGVVVDEYYTPSKKDIFNGKLNDFKGPKTSDQNPKMIMNSQERNEEYNDTIKDILSMVQR